MFCRCKHRWIEVSRYFAAPPTRSIKVSYMSVDQMEQLLFGVTIVELRCSVCNDLTERRLLGTP